MQDLIVTIIQCELIWEDTEANLEAFAGRFASITSKPDLIVLPEMFSTGFSMNGEKCAEEPNGPAFKWLQRKSSEMNAVIACSVMVRENRKLFNRFLWVRPDGTYDSYDKRHLFRFGKEHEHFESGYKILISELKGWKFRPLVCYDLRFPVWCRNKYQNGQFEYDCLICVANWPERRRHHWNGLLAARAIENLSYSMGVNRIGKDGNGIIYSGDSQVIDPTGLVAGNCEPNKEEIITVTLSSETLMNWRSCFNVGQDWDKFSLL
jgi:omega-amidase